MTYYVGAGPFVHQFVLVVDGGVVQDANVLGELSVGAVAVRKFELSFSFFIDILRKELFKGYSIERREKVR